YYTFPVDITQVDTIGNLKKAIKKEKGPEFDDIAADKLTLHLANFKIKDDDEDAAVNLKDYIDAKKLKPTNKTTKAPKK
ncbi:hypothetical protein BGZ46_004726, partial [Entomortierella lignicola]